jgi:pimeloyl-ACP methyl ester carboxylesterase
VALAHVDGLDIDYEDCGDPSAPPVLLVMGLGMPAAMWPEPFVAALVSRGLRVIRFDNRDCGHSTKLDGLGIPKIGAAIARALFRLRVRSPYSLDDMARDAIGLLDVLAIQRVHVVGASMGGMIAQVMAARWPDRVASLTSIMSTSGNPRPSIALGERRALKAILSRPARTDDVGTIVDHLLGVFGVIGSPAYPIDPAVMRPHFERVVRRGLYPAGTARQLAAVLASGDRRALLEQITAPTLVIHGAADPLLPVAAGRDTAEHIPDATLRVIEGMGHDFPPALHDELARMVATHCLAAQAPSAPLPAGGPAESD